MGGIFGVFGVLKIWMLIDCIQRFGLGSGCGTNPWIYIIAFIPGGEFAYFALVKCSDPSLKRSVQPICNKLFKRQPNLSKLRYQTKHCPSIVNKHLLASALSESKLWQEALPLYEELAQDDPTSAALAAELANVLWHLDLREKSILCLRDALSTVPSSDRDETMLELAKRLDESQKSDEALLLVEEIARRTHKIEHIVIWSSLLIKLGRTGEAKPLLKNVIEEYQQSPRFIQRDKKTVFRTGKALLKLTDVAL